MVKTRVTHKTLFEGTREGDYLTAAIISNIVRWKSSPGGAPHMKGVGMLVGNFELNP